MLLLDWMMIPAPGFPEITFRAPGAVPPIVLPVADWMTMPWLKLDTAFVPVTSVPMRFPWMVLPLPEAREMFATRLAEMRLPAPSAVPPMLLLDAETATPDPPK